LFGRKKQKQVLDNGLPAPVTRVEDGGMTTDPEATPAAQEAAQPLQVRTQLRTTIDGGATVIDARNVPGLRDELLKAVHDAQAGGDPTELRDAVMKAMGQGTAIPIAGMASPPAAVGPPAEDPLDRLQKLNELRQSGALTDAEFEAMKAKLLRET
jgi:hypothetical protein